MLNFKKPSAVVEGFLFVIKSSSCLSPQKACAYCLKNPQNTRKILGFLVLSFQRGDVRWTEGYMVKVISANSN